MATRSSKALVMSILAALALATHAGDARPTEESAVIAVTETFRAHFAKGNLMEVSQLYTDDAMLLPPNETAISGRKEILAWFEKNMRPVMPARLSFHDYEIYGNGETATSVSWMEMYNDSGQIVLRGKQTVVLVKKHGQWKIHRDMWSEDMPSTPTKRSPRCDGRLPTLVY